MTDIGGIKELIEALRLLHIAKNQVERADNNVKSMCRQGTWHSDEYVETVWEQLAQAEQKQELREGQIIQAAYDVDIEALAAHFNIKL